LDPVPPGSISGLVIRSSDGQPLSGVTITVKDAAGNTIATTTTGAPQTINGYTFNYKIDPVPVGVTYTLTASKAGFPPNPVSRQATVVTGVETKNVNFSMEPLHTFPAALTMVSAPFDYPNADVADLLAISLNDRFNPNVFK